jgi:hypothetical protein
MRIITVPQRKELLRTIPADRWWDDMIREIVGRDPELYRFLLDIPSLQDYHLAPLRGHPEGAAWITMATTALDSGHEPEDIVRATRAGGWSWAGDESEMWKSWIAAYEALQSHTDPRLQEVGRLGVEYAKAHQNRALKTEHNEAVYGIR